MIQQYTCHGAQSFTVRLCTLPQLPIFTTLASTRSMTAAPSTKQSISGWAAVVQEWYNLWEKLHLSCTVSELPPIQTHDTPVLAQRSALQSKSQARHGMSA